MHLLEGEEMSKEVMKLALEALVAMSPSGPTGSLIWHQQMYAITALRKALKPDWADKPTQVPEQLAKYVAALVAGTHEITSLTILPKRTWVGLTDEERSKIWGELPSTRSEERDACIFAECLELYLKEKNT